MADLTTPERVAALWQPIPTDQQDRVTALIGKASRRIRHAYPDIETRMASGAIDADLVADVATDMVIRVLRNPEGLKRVTVDDYTAERDASTASGLMALTADELDLLAPGPSGSVSEGTIVPSWGDRC